MASHIGVSVDSENVSAVLLIGGGKTEKRTTKVDSPIVGDLVSSAIGVMQVRSASAGLAPEGIAVACNDPAVISEVRAALGPRHVDAVRFVPSAVACASFVTRRVSEVPAGNVLVAEVSRYGAEFSVVNSSNDIIATVTTDLSLRNLVDTLTYVVAQLEDRSQGRIVGGAVFGDGDSKNVIADYISDRISAPIAVPIATYPAALGAAMLSDNRPRQAKNLKPGRSRRFGVLPVLSANFGLLNRQTA